MYVATSTLQELFPAHHLGLLLQDSGLNVPKLSVSVKAYGSGSDESDQSDSYSSQSKSHTENHNEHTESTKSSSSYYQKSADPSTEHTESPKKVDPSSYINQKKTAVTHSFQPQLESRVPESHYEPEHYTQPKKKADPSPTKVHHHAKCSSKPKKCQAQTAQQYHNARSKHTHRSISKVSFVASSPFALRFLAAKKPLPLALTASQESSAQTRPLLPRHPTEPVQTLQQW
jgi:hypothetical protein